MKITSFQLRKFNKATKIMDVISYYGIRVESDGISTRFRAFCPFHMEKSPSLKLYLETNTWCAFCCGRGSTPYDLIYAKEGNEETAINVLLEIANIDLEADPLATLSEDLETEVSIAQKQGLEVQHYLISVMLRDFLEKKKEREDYANWCSYIDRHLTRLDELLDEDETSEEHLRVFKDQIALSLQVALP
jgi:hypothetical protein